jgi:hypothetical protein
VHLRRALLLFAIVLGMAALAASLSRPVEQQSAESERAQPRGEPGPPTAAPQPAPAVPSALSFVASENESMRLTAGDAATVEVSVQEAGTVAIPDMGLSAAADRLTPARFDVLGTRPGRYELVFTPADGDVAEPAGRLVVSSAG